MKKCALVILFVTFWFSCHAQNFPTKDVLFKECNVLVVTTQDSTTVAYKKMQFLMRDSGMTLSNANAEMASASGTTMDKRAGTVVVSFYVTDTRPNKIIISGTYDPNISVNLYGVTASGASKIENIGMKGSPARNAFVIMDNLAKSYEGGSVVYGYRK